MFRAQEAQAKAKVVQKVFGLGGLQVKKSIKLKGISKKSTNFKENDISARDLDNDFEKMNETDVNVRAADPLISGGLSQEEIYSVTNKAKDNISDCYNKYKIIDNISGGRVQVKWTIQPNGKTVY